MFLKMGQNLFYLIEQASDMSKINITFIIYACCLNKTTKTINKLTNEQPSSHFFLTDPLSLLISRVPTVSWELLFWIPCKFFTRILVLIIAFSSCIMQMSAKIIIYACCLNKATKTANKSTNEPPSSHFFLTDPLQTYAHTHTGMTLCKED